MGKRAVLILTVAVMAMVILPATAFGGLINEYGMHYAGQTACVNCHTTVSADQVHGRFATPGLSFAAPEDWTVFRGAGDPPVIPGTAPARFNGGGYYSIGETWVTLGDTLGNSGGEYMFFEGSTDPTVMPWNLVEGLASEPGGVWLVAEGEPAGLFDVQYGCQRCHMLGSTMPKASATTVATVPNPAATVAVTETTAKQWARPDNKTVADFMEDPTVSYPGLGIQCENCHGTGTATGHGGAGTSTSLAVLGQSQVCGQCHGSYTNVATLGIIGYTTNLPMRTFVDINGVSPATTGQSYTKIPTVEEFMASPTAYFMFPNGSNAKGSHYYYNEWSASAHSYRGALTKTSADATAYQAAGNGHYNATTSSLDCAKCHTGEGYLKSKNAKIANRFTPTSGTVGLMGQECVTCHDGHPSAAGGANVVREPDPAGARSATGLSKGNDSICEDCHNWQYEVLGTTPSYAPMANITAHGGASHPQRETLQGRSMVQIANAGEFMPGAKCEQCHMPKTNKGANRFSHGMKIMLPGDAETWNTKAGASYLGEDSCSNCHPNDSRSELQAYVDKWQAEATAEAAKAAAAITAAQTRTEYSLTDTTKPGYTLVGEATWNYKVFANDGSTGAHNPEYMVAGLVKAQKLAASVGGSFKSVRATARVKRGRTAFVWGKVANGDGTAAADATLALYKNGKDTGLTAKANANGVFAFSFAATGTHPSYRVSWLRASDLVTHRMCAATVRIRVVR